MNTDEIIEIANVRASKFGLTPEAVIERALYYAERAEPTPAGAVQWAIDTLTKGKPER